MHLEKFLLLFALRAAIGTKIHIIDGKDAAPRSHPWILQLVPGCAASLIRVPCMQNASNIAVTAAHCNSGSRVIAGKHGINSEPQQVSRNVKQFAPHPKFITDLSAKYLEHDIAVLELDEPIPFSDNIQPIDLPKDDVQEHNNCTIAGWGTQKSINKWGRLVQEQATVLQELHVKILSRSFCETLFLEKYKGDTMICIGRQEIGPDDSLGTGCSGDSGGPLICKEGGTVSLQGITSGGDDFCNTPGVYTRVSAYLVWITEQIKTWNICP